MYDRFTQKFFLTRYNKNIIHSIANSMLCDISHENFNILQDRFHPMCPELIDWFFFDHFVLRSTTISNERKLSGMWVGDISSQSWPQKTQIDTGEKTRLVTQCQIFISECYAESNPWNVVCNDENYVSVFIRNNCSWDMFKSSLDMFSRGAILSFADWTMLRNFGLNSAFATTTKDKGTKFVPFGIIGLMNHSCQSRFQMSCGKGKKSIGGVINFSIDYYLREEDENSAIYVGSNQNFINPTFIGSNEFHILYSENPGFPCMCGHANCISNDTVDETSTSKSSEPSAIEKSLASSTEKIFPSTSTSISTDADNHTVFSSILSSALGNTFYPPTSDVYRTGKRKKSSKSRRLASFRQEDLILSYRVSFLLFTIYYI